MNARISARFAAIAFGAASALVIVACSSDDSSNANPTPGVHDSGTTNNPDGTVIPQGDSGQQSDDGGPGVDSNLPDVGPCTSDAAHCNSCYTPEQNPVNGCSPAAVNCIPFDNARVPANAP